MPVDALPAAFSVPSQVETIGALAGLAAILGLAVLSMLYFAQARELKRLREWAGRAPERAAELQERAMAPAPRRVTPQPVTPRPPGTAATPQRTATPRPPGAPAAGTPAAAAGGIPGATATPSAPATPSTPGTGKPATAAATAAAAAETAAPGSPGAPANGQTGTPGAPAAPTSPDAAKPADAGQEAPADQTAEGPQKDAPSPDDTTIGPKPTDAEQPTTAQPAAKPAVPQPLPVPASARPATAAAGAAGAAGAARPAGQRPRAAAPLRSGNPSATIPPRGGARGGAPAGGDDGGGNRALRIGLVVGAIVLVLAAGVFAFTQLTGGDDAPSSRKAGPGKTATQEGNTIGPAAGAKTSTQEAAQPKGETTVAVLNGTTVAGLARGVADKLLADGYKIGTVTNAPDQQRSATQVAYQRGQQRAARAVARAIDVGSDAVVPIDEVTEATAGSDALIVVTVGADQSP
jgi:hypothetical protein